MFPEPAPAPEHLLDPRAALEILELDDGLFVLDPEYRIVFVNRSFERLSGRRREDVLGQVFWVVFPEAASPESRFWLEYRRAMRERVAVRFEERYAPLDVWNEVSAHPVRGGGIAVFFRDITEQKRAEAALRSSEEKYRLIVETAGEGIAITRPDGVYTYVNQQMAEMLGYGVEDMLGRRISDFTFPEWAERVPALRSALGRGEAVRGDFLLRHRDGSQLWAMYRASPLTNDRGEHVGTVATLLDITAWKDSERALRESEERTRAHAAELETVLDTVPAAVWITRDTRGERIDANRFGVEILRQRPGENVSLSAPGEDRPRGFSVYQGGRKLSEEELGIQRAARWGEDVRDMEVDLVFDNGDVCSLLGNCTPLRDREGRVTGSVGAFIDITARKRMEEEVREADRRKSEFLAVLSHELRNPLAPIHSSLFLLDKLPSESPGAARARAVIHRQVEHLTRLVEDLLDVTRIARGKVHLRREPVDLRDLVRKTCEDHRTLFQQARLDLHLDLPASPVPAEVDPTRIGQVIGNLLANASKFTPPPGAVAVRVRVVNGQAEVSVRDSGMGMEREQLARLFEPFAQEERSLGQSPSGLGLGLALSKGLVELHGGSILARSEGAGKGSEFVLALPMAAQALPPEPIPPAPRTSGQHRRILVIDDNADAAQTLADVLGLFGHEVTIAPNGLAGTARARELLPDVVICDLGLPDVDGYEVARALRADGALRAVRLIALSGYGMAEDKDRALKAGFEAHLTRPASLETLEALLG